jgi:hypothetical protein
MGFERRFDPRTDPTFSLRNLLRTRADRLGVVAALGTDQGVVMASSHPGRPVEEALAHASHGSARGPVRRVVVEGRVALLAAIGAPDERAFDELAERVGAILREGRI